MTEYVSCFISPKLYQLTVPRRLVIRYESIEAFEEFGENIEDMYGSRIYHLPYYTLLAHLFIRVHEKFGEVGGEKFRPLISTRSFPPIQFTVYGLPLAHFQFGLNGLILTEDQVRRGCLAGLPTGS